MNPESRLVAQIRRVFDRVPNAWHEKNHLEFTCPALRGQLLAFEVKMPGKKLTRAQVLYSERMTRAGAVVYRVDNVESVKAILRAWRVLDV
jgi:hypothetical protein